MRFFKGLKFKLFLVAVPSILFLFAVAMVGYQGVQKIDESFDIVNSAKVPELSQALELRVSLNTAMRWTWASLALGGEDRKKYLAKMQDEIKNFDSILSDFSKLKHSDNINQELSNLKKNWSEVSPKLSELSSMIASGCSTNVGGDYILKNILPFTLKVTESSEMISSYTYQETGEEKVKMDKQIEFIKTILLLASALGCLIAVTISIFFAIRLSRTLIKMIDMLRSSGASVTSSSQELSNASESLSKSAIESASSLEQAVSSIEEISSMIKLNADHAKEAAALAQASRDSAEQGENEIRDLTAAMHDIAKSSKKIEEIINVIDDIAFQTNLLALNAAVEAARAGEQGKGFAVVAEAVRNLAQRSAVAAKDINSLIKESVSKIDNGTKIADSSGEVLKNIVVSVKKVSDLNNEISSASAEQADGISSINRTMNTIDRSTQQTASSSEEVSASSETLLKEAEVLHHSISELAKLVHGDTEILSGDLVVDQKREERIFLSKKEKSHLPTMPTKPKNSAAQSNVVSLAKKPVASKAQELIPFDDEPSDGRKVGTTDGF